MVVCKFFQQGKCYYGNSCRFEHNYDSKYSYRAPQLESTKNSHSVVSHSKPSGQGLTSATSLFRKAVQNTSNFENASSHTFTQNQPARTSVFDRLGPQPSNVFNSQKPQGNQARSIFAQANQNVFGQTHNQSPSVFQTHNQSPSVFQTHNQSANVFQTHNQSANVFKTHNQPHNVFQSQNQSANAKSLFAQATQSAFGQQPTINMNVAEQIDCEPSNRSSNIFQIVNPTSNVFGTNNVFEKNQVINDVEVYSKIEDLSQSDIDAFESEDFRLGYIPELPPPRALCAM